MNKRKSTWLMTLATAGALMLGGGLIGCDDDAGDELGHEMDEVGDKVHDAVDDAGDNLEEAADDVKDATN